MIEIIKLIVTIISFASVSDGESTAVMLGFDATAESEYFTGATLPGGVDTQKYNPEGGTLSARYILEGIDCAGDSCRIFIENNAIQGAPYTTPTIITDSKALSFLNTAPLQGSISTEDDQLVIRICAQMEEK